MIKVAPSILSADFSCLADEIKRVENAGADWLHIDVMDGHFVPNITIGAPVVKSIRKVSNLFFDVHLMIENPDRYIEDFASAGADLICVHVEACVHLHRTIQLIKGHGKKVGVSLNPATSLAMIEEVLPLIDMVLIMTVNPGSGGQTFISSCLSKIRRLKAMIDQAGLSVAIEVDGGVIPNNAGQIVEAGADILVAGSAIFGQPDVNQAITTLRAGIASK